MLAKQGIEVREHKLWNTKTIYNRGHVMRIYRHCPTLIHFESKMVNDYNQHLCGGWQMDDIPNNNLAIFKQLETGQKPFGIMCYWETDMHKLHESRIALGNLGLKCLAKSQNRKQIDGPDTPELWNLMACQDMDVGEIGDLDLLRQDYHDAGIDIDTRQVASEPLTTFFGGYDHEDIPIWLTGLILGYPVENTISMYSSPAVSHDTVVDLLKLAGAKE